MPGIGRGPGRQKPPIQIQQRVPRRDVAVCDALLGVAEGLVQRDDVIARLRGAWYSYFIHIFNLITAISY